MLYDLQHYAVLRLFKFKICCRLLPFKGEHALLLMIDEGDAAEATLVLNFIFMMKNGPQRPDKVPKTSHCLAMLNFLREDAIKVTSYF